MKITTVTSVLVLLLPPSAAGAQTPDWYRPRNLVEPAVDVSVSLDPVSGDFRYEYTIGNGPGAQQRLNTFRLEQVVSAAAMSAPEGWEHIGDAELGGLVGWYASGEARPDATVVHELDVPSTVSEIEPGASLSGFVLLSPCAADAAVRYYARGYNHISVRPLEDDTWARVPDWREDSATGLVVAPGDCTSVYDWGNRRPAVDGFVGLVRDPAAGSSPTGGVTIQLRFSRSGEAVDRSTLQVTLNRVDVTAAFATNSLGDAVAVFGPEVLEPGRNVLLVSVEGVVPGTSRTATDADRWTFMR